MAVLVLPIPLVEVVITRRQQQRLVVESGTTARGESTQKVTFVHRPRSCPLATQTDIEPRAFSRTSASKDRNGLQVLLLSLILFFGVFGAGLLYTQSPWRSSKVQASIGYSANFACEVVDITDGDTFRCADGTRVRLSGVAARETNGTCSPGHPCPTASAEAATAALHNLAYGEAVRCQGVGETYGRVAAFCRREDGLDLSCAMIQTGTVAKWWRYWGLHSC